MFTNLIQRYKDIFFYKTLERNLSDCKDVLDVGCGSNSPIRYIKKKFKSEGLDLFKKSIAESREKRIHSTYRIGNISNLDKLYKPKSFDAVIALDVIEHFEKKEAIALIKKMEKVARKKVILLTPNVFYRQGEHEGNPYQIHKSRWGVKDFKAKSCNVFGLRGLKYMRGEYASIKYRPWIIWGLIAFISEPLLYFIPSLSYHLFVIKNLYESEK